MKKQEFLDFISAEQRRELSGFRWDLTARGNCIALD